MMSLLQGISYPKSGEESKGGRGSGETGLGTTPGAVYHVLPDGKVKPLGGFLG
jgi:hypothetical protein